MFCQKCRSPLKPDTALDNLNPAAFDLLVGSTTKSQRRPTSTNLNYPQERKATYDRSVHKAQPPLHRRSIPPSTSSDVPRRPDRAQSTNPAMSFIEITESQIVSPEAVHHEATTSTPPPTNVHEASESLGWRMKRQQHLFDILSSQSDIDHPVCAECSSLLISQFSKRLACATRERDAYASFLKQLHQVPPVEAHDAAAKQLKSLKQEEEQAFGQLVQLEEEKKTLEAELAALEEESQMLDIQERKFWEGRNSFDDALYETETELDALQRKYAHDQRQLEKLQRTNVYNDTFCIGHDGYFGTINGLRLGRLPNQNVEWAEINAAWGQTLLLLATIAERLSFTFQGYRLRPLGSTSRIEKLEWPQEAPEPAWKQTNTANPPAKVTQLDLFSSGDLPLGRMFNHRRFDAGMVAFLECLRQVGNHIEKTSKLDTNSARTPKLGQLAVPYVIEGDKIDGVSIKLGAGFSQDENFTKACKFALTCCKFLLAHVSSMESTRSA